MEDHTPEQEKVPDVTELLNKIESIYNGASDILQAMRNRSELNSNKWIMSGEDATAVVGTAASGMAMKAVEEYINGVIEHDAAIES